MSPALIEPADSARSDRLRMTVLGQRVRAERSSHGLSLDRLAERSGVSRSMLSAIELGAKVPTVLVLDRIAGALGVSVSRLLEEPREGHVIALPHHEQKQVVADGGWARTIVSPVLPGLDLELGRLEFEPHADAGEFGAHQSGWTEYVAVEEGKLQIILNGSDRHVLNAGDALYYESDLTHAFRNLGDTRLVAYILMLAHKV